MMVERGVEVDHTIIYRWVQAYSPELDRRCRCDLRPSNDSWRVDETYIDETYIDETYIKVKKRDHYPYRAVDSSGQTLDFMLSTKRDAKTAQRFFLKVLSAPHAQLPRVINVDKDKAYPPATKALETDEVLPQTTTRQCKYLNNIVEQDHRFIKRRIRSSLSFSSFKTAWRTLQGDGVMNMIRKDQISGIAEGNVMGQVSFINEIFGITA